MNNRYNSTKEQTEAVVEQFAKFAIRLSESRPKDLPRTFGFEIETPSADYVYERATRHFHTLELDCSFSDVLNFTSDGSVDNNDGTNASEGEDCYCECEDCTFHSCDCEHCEGNGSEDPSHDCGNCGGGSEYQEITSVGGLNTTHPLALDILKSAKLYDADINKSCGLHVHVGCADMTPAEIARVISAYRSLADIINPIAGRVNVYYANTNTDEDITATRNGNGTTKYKAVNTGNAFSNYRAKTIEFRQHAGTNSTTAVRAWAILLVALTEYAKNNLPVYWLARCADFDELAKELQLDKFIN